MAGIFVEHLRPLLIAIAETTISRTAPVPACRGIWRASAAHYLISDLNWIEWLKARATFAESAKSKQGLLQRRSSRARIRNDKCGNCQNAANEQHQENRPA
jgi:hypothetical protein